jgi:hypothetical protein
MNTTDNLALYNHFLGQFGMPVRLSALALRDLLQIQLQSQCVNPLNKFGNKVYSQNDEDGITFEIARRLGISRGTFLELGVGNGTENNTLALLAAGWRGCWLGGEDLSFGTDVPEGSAKKLGFRKAWLTPQNCAVHAKEEMAGMQISSVDLLSVDLDGNDVRVTEQLLEAGISPRILVIEYNAKFPPPIEFSIDVDDSHQWSGDDYMGASLQFIVNRLSARGYRLVCCSLSGCNAFFVKQEDMEKFSDTPTDIRDIFQPARYHFSYLLTSGHPISMRTIQCFLRGGF